MYTSAILAGTIEIGMQVIAIRMSKKIGFRFIVVVISIYLMLPMILYGIGQFCEITENFAQSFYRNSTVFVKVWHLL